MSPAYDLAVLLHVIGFAMMLGPLLAQWRREVRRVLPVVFYGSVVQFMSGVALVAMTTPGDAGAPHPYKIGLKVLLALLLMALTWANQRWEQVPHGLWWLLVVLALGEAGVGVLWH